MPSRILIVDDEVGLCGIMVEKLQALGFSALSTTSGHQAIEILQRGHVDLVITDYYMKEGDGASLAHYCSNHGVSCIVITSLDPANVKPYLPANVYAIRKIEFVTSSDLKSLIKNTLSAA